MGAFLFSVYSFGVINCKIGSFVTPAAQSLTPSNLRFPAFAQYNFLSFRTQ